MYRGTLYVILLSILHTESYKVAVKVKQGIIIGTKESTLFDRKIYYAFYGVPYARAPVKSLRFKNPKSQKTWDEPYDGSVRFHGACAQAHIVHKHGLFGVEDCLHLNIYTPSLPTKEGSRPQLKAVVIWIHGYAFASSFSHIHGGDLFIENDVIFISLTHRLGVFGFLKYNDTDSNSNMGLRDIVQGLKWIRKNIEYFSGDKNRITVMASDSAATFLSLLLMTKSRNLFSKVILQSGGLFSPSIFQGNPLQERNILSDYVKEHFSKELIKASTNDIITASLKIYKRKDWVDFQKPIIPFSPIVDSSLDKPLIKSSPNIDLKKLKANIPIMIGFNTQESITEVIPFIRYEHYLNMFKKVFKFMVPFAGSCSHKYVSNKYTEIANVIKKKYFKDGISGNSVLSFVRYVSDLHRYPMYKYIKALLNGETKNMYVYKFNYVGKLNVMKASSLPGVNIKIKGAAKGDEICYLMRCEPLRESYLKLRRNNSDPDRIFMKELSEIWSNFVKSGNPTPKQYFGNVTWLPMSSTNDKILLLSKQSRLIDSKSEEKMFSFWNKIYNDYYSPQRCNANIHEEL